MIGPDPVTRALVAAASRSEDAGVSVPICRNPQPLFSDSEKRRCSPRGRGEESPIGTVPYQCCRGGCEDNSEFIDVTVRDLARHLLIFLNYSIGCCIRIM